MLLRRALASLRRPGSAVGVRSFASHGEGRKTEKFWLFGLAAATVPVALLMYRRQQAKKARSPLEDFEMVDGAIVLKSLDDPSQIVEDKRKKKRELPEKAQHVLLKTKYLLIGGGLASFAALETILSKEPQADIILVTEESYAPYMRAPLSKELWYNHEPQHLKEETFDFADWHGNRKPIFFQDPSFYHVIESPVHEATNLASVGKPKLMTGKRAVAIDTDANVVTLHDGTKIEFDRALIATGASSRQLTDFTNPDVKGVSRFRDLSDFKRLREIVEKADHLAIIGGGFIGSELAAAIASFSSIQRPSNPIKISQIFPEEGNMGLVFPKYLSSWTSKQLRRLGIEIFPNSSILNISHLPEERVRISFKQEGAGEQAVDADHVVIAIGAQPNIAMAKDSGMMVDESEFGSGALRASPYLELVHEKVYGAGSCISFFDNALGIWRRVDHYDHALLSGRIAGHNMTARSYKDYEPYAAASLFWSDLGPHVGYEAIGLIDSSLTTIGVWAKADVSETPMKVELSPDDIRAEPVGQTAPGSVEPVSGHQPKALPPQEEYRKGLVLYVRDKRIVGLLMFNLFNRTALARSVIRQKFTVDDLQDVVELFNINDSA